MKFLILLAYFNRPNLVKFAIHSVLSQSYSDWEMVVCDDGSDVPIQNVLNDMNVKDARIKIKRLNDSIEYKQQHGSRSGLMLNEAMSESDADVVIVLCDDDGLFPDCLENLSSFYKKNDVPYSYGFVSIYDPSQLQDYTESPAINMHSSLNHGLPVQPSCTVDASQVSWRLNDQTCELFPYPQTAALDAAVFQKLYELYSLCMFNEITVQYKGIFQDQLGRRMLSGSGIDPIIK